MTRLMLLLLLAGAAHAQVTTLTYQGGPLNALGAAFREGPICELRLCLTGTITLSGPLAANLFGPGSDQVGAQMTPMNFQLTYGDGGPPYFVSGLAWFSTDAEGHITGWLIVATSQDGSAYLVSSSGGDTVTGAGSPYPLYSIAGPGTWTQSALAAPPPPPPATVKVLDCAGYKVIAPSSTAILNVSPNPTGSPSECKLPGSVPGSWYVKTTTNGGHSWAWTTTLESLGL